MKKLFVSLMLLAIVCTTSNSYGMQRGEHQIYKYVINITAPDVTLVFEKNGCEFSGSMMQNVTMNDPQFNGPIIIKFPNGHTLDIRGPKYERDFSLSVAKSSDKQYTVILKDVTTNFYEKHIIDTTLKPGTTPKLRQEEQQALGANAVAASAKAQASNRAIEKAQATTQGKKCAFCKETCAGQRCGRCKKVSYCSRNCQGQDWAEHKKICQAQDESGK